MLELTCVAADEDIGPEDGAVATAAGVADPGGDLYLQAKSFRGFFPGVKGPEYATKSAPEVLTSVSKQYPSTTLSICSRRVLSFGRQATRRN